MSDDLRDAARMEAARSAPASDGGGDPASITKTL